MNLFRRLFYCGLLLIPSALAYSQSSYPHTLLWRISGKGMQKPSYLYGTMHLSDKRLFLFGDSIYRAIEKTDGLAIEVNPDEMGAYFVNKLFDDIGKGKKLNEVLGKDYFARNRVALSKKFRKPAEEISTADIVKEKNKWMTEYFEKGEMPTFMDAYLFNIARRQGKWLGGIEDVTDQTGLMDDMVDQSDINYLLATDSTEQASGTHHVVERMISLYSDQDLEGIEAFTNGSETAEQKDKMLIHRNVKMARRIDSLSALRTMFVAIGAAHLPGDSGVISLLRKRGFTVEPVFSGKKIAASDYTFQEVHLPWVPVTDVQGSYKVEMPANPATVKLYGLIEMKFLMDMSNMSAYGTMAVINQSRFSNRDSLFSMLAERLFQSGKSKIGRSLEKDGFAGKEFIETVGGSNLRMQVFADDKMIYMAMISAFKKDVVVSADADKFFHSFTINHREQTAGATRTFTDSVMGISFATSAVVTYNEKLSSNRDESWKISSYTGADPATSAYVMLFSKEIKAGYHIVSDSAIHDLFYQKMKEQYTDMQMSDTTVDNCREIRLSGKNILQPNIFMHGLSVVRNGRHILLLIISDLSSWHGGGLERVLSSFHFIPHPSVHWQTDSSPDSSFTGWGPSRFRSFIYKSGLEWVAYDTTTSTSYLVIPDTLGKYAWYPSDSLFWTKMVKNNTGNGQLLVVKDIKNGEISGKEIFVKNDKERNAYKRIRLLLSGDKIYKLFVYGEKELLYNDETNLFFDSFRLNAADPRSTVTVSKAPLLLQDLGSRDSAIRQNAFSALRSASFVKEDEALLRDALFKAYLSPYNSSTATVINNQIAVALSELKDSSSVTFIQKVYPSLTEEKRIYQNTALFLLAEQPTSYSYGVLAELLQRGPTTERLGYRVLYALKKNPALTSSLFPSFQAWVKDSLQSPSIANVTLSLLDSGYIKIETVARSAGAFISAANELLPVLKEVDDYSDAYLTSLLKLIGRFRTPASYNLLKSYLAVKNKYVLEEVVLQLLEGGQAVPDVVLNRLAADPVHRTILYDHLKKVKKTALFPKLYLTQSYFAESAIYDATNDEDDDRIVDKVILLSKKIAPFQGKNYTWYLYKVTYKDDDDGSILSYLGIAGGYDLTGVALKPQKDLSGIYWKEVFDGSRIPSFLKAYLKKADNGDDD